MSYCIGGEAPLIYSTGFKEFNDNAENYPFDEIESIAQHLIMDSLFRKLINKRINVDEVIDEAGNFITRIPYTTESKKRYESTIFLIVESVRKMMQNFFCERISLNSLMNILESNREILQQRY